MCGSHLCGGSKIRTCMIGVLIENPYPPIYEPISKVYIASTPFRHTTMFARPIFTDRAGRLTKLFHISH